MVFKSSYKSIELQCHKIKQDFYSRNITNLTGCPDCVLFCGGLKVESDLSDLPTADKDDFDLGNWVYGVYGELAIEYEVAVVESHHR